MNRKQLFAAACCVMLLSCNTMQRTELYFGTDIPGGGSVTEQQWTDFCNNTITKYFPEGYTEYNANGKWYDAPAGHTISEKSKVIMFAGKKGKKRTVAIDSIAQKYIHDFHQQSVLRIDVPAKVHFISSGR